jgi:hypothetical protein
VHAVTIEGRLGMVLIGLGQDDVLGFAVESVVLFQLLIGLYIYLSHQI